MYPFTDDEEKLLTPFDACAHDNLDITATTEGKIIPAWLCMSVEARADARANIMEHFKRELYDVTIDFGSSDEYIEYINKFKPPEFIMWREREALLKIARMENNPRGFFIR